MRITADTNVLVRAAALDDPGQAAIATALLRDSEFIAVTLPALCEFVWVMRRLRFQPREVQAMIKTLIASANVDVDRAAVEAGLAMLEGGGDFANGIIAFEGRRQGGAVFASFDRRAAELVAANGGATYLLGA